MNIQQFLLIPIVLAALIVRRSIKLQFRKGVAEIT